MAVILDKRNGLTRGLVFDLPLFEKGGVAPRDTVGKLIGTLSGPTWVMTPYGKVLDYSAADSTPTLNFTTPTNINNMNLVSIETLILIRVAGASNDRIVSKGATSNSWFQFATNTTDLLDFNTSWNGGLNFGEWTFSVGYGLWRHVVVTYDGTSSANVPIAYVNGKSVTLTTVTSPSGSRDADTTSLGIGNRSEGVANRSINGQIAYVRMWNRILTAGEVSDLYSNPWEIYRRWWTLPMFSMNGKVPVAPPPSTSPTFWRSLMGVGF